MAMLADQGDITLAELQSVLAARDIRVGIGTLRPFFQSTWDHAQKTYGAPRLQW